MPCAASRLRPGTSALPSTPSRINASYLHLRIFYGTRTTTIYVACYSAYAAALAIGASPKTLLVLTQAFILRGKSVCRRLL